MKNQLMLALGFATFAAVAAPVSAQGTNGKSRSGVYDRNGDGVIDSRDQARTDCSWYDVNCNITNSRTGSTADGSWQVAGRDRNGETIYQRRRTERNGNVVLERARRDSSGRYIIINSQVLNGNSRRTNETYGVNGETCKYKENKNGYKTECKYNKVKGKKAKKNDDRYDDDRYERRGNNRSGPWYDTRAQASGKGHR